MRDDFDEEDGPRRRHRTRRRRRRESRREGRGEGLAEGGSEERELSPEQRAYRRARARADEKVKVTEDALKVGGLALFLAILHLGWVALIVLIVGGMKLGRRFYDLVVEPKLRQRFIREEVEKQVHANLSQERQTLEGEHARSMEQLSASIAHEIRNPITAAKSLVQQMEEDPSAQENVEYARVALEELQRVERSVSHLLRFARDEEMSLGEVHMAEVVDSALETFRDRVSRSGIVLERNLDGDGAMRGDPEKLRRVVINLVGNAIDALVETGTEAPRIEVHMGENLAGSHVWLRVADNGPGIESEVRQKLFSPFYTSKANGTGLGLAISRKLVEAHRGSIEVESAPGVGSTFLITFPKQPVSESEGAES